MLSWAGAKIVSLSYTSTFTVVLFVDTIFDICYPLLTLQNCRFVMLDTMLNSFKYAEWVTGVVYCDSKHGIDNIFHFWKLA